jgi:hypothetical protein
VIDVDRTADLSAAIAAARRAGLRAERAEIVISGLCDRCAA